MRGRIRPPIHLEPLSSALKQCAPRPSLWGSGILVELDYVLEGLDTKRGREDSDERRRHLVKQMRHAFPGAEIK